MMTPFAFSTNFPTLPRVQESKTLFHEEQAQLYCDPVNTVASLDKAVSRLEGQDALNHLWTFF